jgi:AcrR family transcriptional regulator
VGKNAVDPVRPGRGRPRSQASEQAIRSATLKILTTEGYSALTVDRVAAMARVSKATIYRRWQNKEHLILAVFQQVPIPIPPEGGSLEEDLIALFSQFRQIMKESPLSTVIPTLVAECLNNPTLSSALMLVNDQRRAPMRLIINRAIRRGELAEDTDVELAIDIIQGAIAIRLYFLLDRITETWIRKLVRVVLKGLGPAMRRPRVNGA